MIDEKKKKKIYIGIIVFCMLVTVYFIFFYGKSGGEGGSAPALLPAATPGGGAPAPTSTSASSSDLSGVDLSEIQFTMPTVFPANPKFASEILETGNFKNLVDYEKLTFSQDEVGREEPFANY